MRGRNSVPFFPYVSRLRAGALPAVVAKRLLWRSRHSAQARITLHVLPLSQPFKFHGRDEDDAWQRAFEGLERFPSAIHNFRVLGVACCG